MFGAFKEAFDWALDVASHLARDKEAFERALDIAAHLARDYPEEVAAVERVRCFMRKRFAGEPAHVRVDDILLTLGLIVGRDRARPRSGSRRSGPGRCGSRARQSCGSAYCRSVSACRRASPRTGSPRTEEKPWPRRRNSSRTSSTRHRNAAPPRSGAPLPQATRGAARCSNLGYTAAGAAGTALLGSFLARQGWAPKTIAGALTAVGAGLAWKGDGSTIKSVGAGTMSAAGSQLALMMIDDRGEARRRSHAAVVKPSRRTPTSFRPAHSRRRSSEHANGSHSPSATKPIA